MCLKGITTLKFQFDQSYQYNNKYLYQPTISFSVFNEFGPFWIDQIRNFHLGCLKQDIHYHTDSVTTELHVGKDPGCSLIHPTWLKQSQLGQVAQEHVQSSSEYL